MVKLPTVTYSQASKALEKAGWVSVRQRGSHVVFKKSGTNNLLTLPDHKSRPLARGLLRKQIAIAGLTVEEFVKLLDC